MKKIIVVGCPGSGKSTFSRELHRLTDIPLYHLDMMYWNKNKTTVEKEIFLERLEEVLKKDGWIVDGNYISTMEMRINACDTVIFMDYPVDVCLDGINARRGKPRADMPWIETEEDAEFVEFIKNFNTRIRPTLIDLLDKHSDKNIIVLKSRSQAENFLFELKNTHCQRILENSELRCFEREYNEE